MERKERLMNQLIELEWEAFDKVRNQGGRASCQDDYDTFLIMRKSQYLEWNEELLQSFLTDLQNANLIGWNLIAEKYARMMESTEPEQYKVVADTLPIITEDKQKVIDGIVDIQVSWMEQFADEYPRAAGNARNIHSYDDNDYGTSYETYLRGELSTYSDNTLQLYGALIVSLLKEGKNLAKLIMANTVKMYGYDSLEALEVHLKK